MKSWFICNWRFNVNSLTLIQRMIMLKFVIWFLVLFFMFVDDMSLKLITKVATDYEDGRFFSSIAIVWLVAHHIVVAILSILLCILVKLKIRSYLDWRYRHYLKRIQRNPMRWSNVSYYMFNGQEISTLSQSLVLQ